MKYEITFLAEVHELVEANSKEEAIEKFNAREDKEEINDILKVTPIK